MTRELLYERDWNFIVDTIYQTNFEDNLDRAMHVVLEALYVLIPCNQVMLTKIEPVGPGITKPGAVDYVGDEPLYLDDFASGGYTDDPYFKYWNSIHETKCFRDTDMMDNEYRESTKLFKDIYAKQGIYYGMRCYLISRGAMVANISLFNSKERGDFSERDTFIMNTLAPHIALRIARERTEKKENEKKTIEMLNRWNLTQREQEIASLVLQGLDDNEIAESLCIARSTFKKHIYNIYQKVDVNNRVQLYAALTK